MANQIHHYLVKSDYIDDENEITATYHEAIKNNTLAALPQELAPHAPQIVQLIDSVFSNLLQSPS